MFFVSYSNLSSGRVRVLVGLTHISPRIYPIPPCRGLDHDHSHFHTRPLSSTCNAWNPCPRALTTKTITTFDDSNLRYMPSLLIGSPLRPAIPDCSYTMKAYLGLDIKTSLFHRPHLRLYDDLQEQHQALGRTTQQSQPRLRSLTLVAVCRERVQQHRVKGGSGKGFSWLPWCRCSWWYSGIR